MICLKFTNQDEALTVLGIDTDDGRIIPCDGTIDGHFCAINVLFGSGTITRQTGGFGEGEKPVFETLPGFHVNILCPTSETLPSLEPYRVTPVNPACVFA